MKGISKILTFCLSVITIFSVSLGCGHGCGEEETLSNIQKVLIDYDISNIKISNDNKTDLVYGNAEFTAMKCIDNDYVLKYRIYLPDGYGSVDKAFPVLMFFHGAGERGNDNTAQIKYSGFKSMFADSASPLLNAVVIAPQCPSGELWVDADLSKGIYSVDNIPESKALSTALKLLKFYDTNGKIDNARVYLMGMSMGGYATWDIMSRHSDLVTASMPICGGCDLTKAELLANIPIYTFHGAKDNIVSPEGTRGMVNAIRSVGGEKIEYMEYPNKYHNIWNDAMTTEGIIEKLFSNIK